MRALQPDIEGFVERDGVKIGYEVFGSGVADDPAAADLGDRALAALEGAGRLPGAGTSGSSPSTRAATAAATGRPTQPRTPPARPPRTRVAVLDATGTDAAVAVGLSLGAGPLLGLAARHPERVLGAVFVAAALGLDDPPTDRPNYSFTDELDTDEGWAGTTSTTGGATGRASSTSSWTTVLSEPHSTKQIEDCIGWGAGDDARDDDPHR